MRLDTHRLQTLDQVRELLAGSEGIALQPQRRADACALVATTVQRFDYALRGKTDKGLLRRFLSKATGLSRAQVTRLLRQHRTTGAVTDRRGAPRRPFARRYTRADIGLLAETDALHGTLSGPATRALCARAWRLFGDGRFERLARISNGHLYNLRRSTTYQPVVKVPAAFEQRCIPPDCVVRRLRMPNMRPPHALSAGRLAALGATRDSTTGCYARRRGAIPQPTRPAQVTIGERRRPQPFGRPGWVRVDTVHQGDLDGIKGLRRGREIPTGPQRLHHGGTPMENHGMS